MAISSAIGLLAGLIGSVATLVGAWGYLRSQHPPKGEILRIVLTIIVIMAFILGLALFISNATTIKINGQKNLPAPPALAPGFLIPLSKSTPSPSSSPTSKPALLSSPTPSSTSTPSSSLTPQSLLTPSPLPTTGPSLTPLPPTKPKKGA